MIECGVKKRAKHQVTSGDPKKKCNKLHYQMRKGDKNLRQNAGEIYREIYRERAR